MNNNINNRLDLSNNTKKDYNVDNIIDIQVIENGYNTSYITSLISALFYKSTNLLSILNVMPQDKNFIYIQEFIRSRFTENLHRGNSIHKETINEFRNFLFNCGWKKTLDDLLNEHDAGDLYVFLMKNIYGTELLSFERICDDVNIGEYNTYLIKLPIPAGVNKVNLTDIFKTWLNSNISMQKYNYRMKKVFNIIPIYIDKSNNKHVKVDIMQKIKLFDVKDNIQDKMVWYVHSIICNSNKLGNYTILRKGKIWVKICDKTIPSITKIDMEDIEHVNKIASDALIVFYKNFNMLNQ